MRFHLHVYYYESAKKGQIPGLSRRQATLGRPSENSSDAFRRGGDRVTEQLGFAGDPHVRRWLFAKLGP